MQSKRAQPFVYRKAAPGEEFEGVVAIGLLDNIEPLLQKVANLETLLQTEKGAHPGAPSR